MLEDNFFEDFLVDCLFLGDEGILEFSWEDLDLRADSRECLVEVGFLEISCFFLIAFVFGCWEFGVW